MGPDTYRPLARAAALAAGALVLLLLAFPLAPRSALALHDMPCADLDGDGEVTTADKSILESYLGQ
jgi:hypothetical protein